MALQFYNRYVPPSSTIADKEQLKRPVKKRKLELTAGSIPASCTSEASVGAEQRPDSSSLSVNGTNEKGSHRKHSEFDAKSADHEDPPEGPTEPKKQKKKKRKEDSESARRPLEPSENFDENRKEPDHVGHPSSSAEPKKKKKKKRNDDWEGAQNSLASDNDRPNNKHEAILSKYSKATEAPTHSAVAGETPAVGHPASSESKPAAETHEIVPFPQPIQSENAPKISVLAALPQWMREPIHVSSKDVLPFSDLPLSKLTVRTLEQTGLDQALPIQSTIVPMLHGRDRHYGDICISAATGSGKTLAYALPLVEALQDRYGHHLKAIIVVPTRELVDQAKDTLSMCAAGTDLKIATAVGSVSLQGEQRALVAKEQRYDPDAYIAENEQVVNEDERLMDWDFDAMMHLGDDEDKMPDYVDEYHSKIDILVCTPGRLVEHIKSTKGFTLLHVQWLVIDEADRLLDESFQEWVEVVIPELEAMPRLSSIEKEIELSSPFIRKRDVCKIILSATMTRDVSKLEALRLSRPKLVILEDRKNAKAGELTGQQGGEYLELPTTLQEFAVPIKDASTKPLALIKILDAPLPILEPPSKVHTEQKTIPGGSALSDASDQKTSGAVDSPTLSSDEASDTEQPSTSPWATPSTHGTLIFTRDNENALRLSRLLALLHPSWSTKIGTLTKSSSSSKGQKTLRAFQDRNLSILIASDRASRGLDIQDLAHVINYDMPASMVSYVHRVGRTARAGKKGTATTLVESHQARWFWNDIARTETLQRGDRKVQRWNLEISVDDMERKAYEDAVVKLGDEAKGTAEQGEKATQKG